MPPKEDCYIYKRPNSSVWQYFLSIEGEGEERKSTRSKDKDKAIEIALDRKLEVMARIKQGLKARRVKKLFDFMDDFLEEEKKRIAPYNKRGFITKETFRQKSHHINWLKKFFHDKNIRLEDLDYPHLYKYPIWRTQVDEKWNPTPPQTNHTIIAELTTIKAYFDYMFRLGYLPRHPEFAKIKSESLRNLRRDYLSPRQYIQTVNTVRAWSKSKSATPSQLHNRQLMYLAILLMSNSCIRIGELRKLKWFHLEPLESVSKEEQEIGHLIKLTRDITKPGEDRTTQSPTVKYIHQIRKLYGLPKHRTAFPHIAPEMRGNPVFSKFRHPDQPLGQGTWDRCWKEIKALCADRYWANKNITWYSFRHTGISFAVSRDVNHMKLSKNCGTGIRYIEEVYYHHEAESKQMWDSLNKNRLFCDKVKQHEDDFMINFEELIDGLDEKDFGD